MRWRVCGWATRFARTARCWSACAPPGSRGPFPLWRTRLSAGLAALGCRVMPGEANYLLFYHSGEQLVQRLRARGVLLRGCANYPGLGPGWYRAAVRTHSENSAFLQALGEVL